MIFIQKLKKNMLTHGSGETSAVYYSVNTFLKSFFSFIFHYFHIFYNGNIFALECVYFHKMEKMYGPFQITAVQ